MVSLCVAPECNTWSGPGVMFFSFPVNRERKSRWLTALKMEDSQLTGEEMLCNAHFIKGRPSVNPRNADYVPTIFPVNNPKPSPTLLKPVKSKVVPVKPFIPTHRSVGCNTVPESVISPMLESKAWKEMETKKRLQNEEDKELIKSMKYRIQLLEADCYMLRRQLSFKPSEAKTHSFSNRKLGDKQIKFYTGLPSKEDFDNLVDIFSDFTLSSTLDLSQQIFITLVRIKQNFSITDLAFRVNLSESNISRLLHQTIPFLAQHLSFLISWPNQLLVSKVPSHFKLFGKCTAILQSYEIMIQKPSKAIFRTRTYCSKRKLHTVKYLLAISPCDGEFCFVSKCFGGCISDKELIGKSGLYNLIKPGDVIMADRKFDIHDELLSRGATLIMPPVMNGRSRKLGSEILLTKELASIRQRIDQIFRKSKNYRIFSTVFPQNLVPMASEVVTICAALSNLGPSLFQDQI